MQELFEKYRWECYFMKVGVKGGRKNKQLVTPKEKAVILP